MCATDNLTEGQKRFIIAAVMLSQSSEHVAKAAFALPGQEERRKKKKSQEKKLKSINTSTSSLLNLAFSGSVDNS